MSTIPETERRAEKRMALLTRTVLLEDRYPFASVRIRNLSALGFGGIASEIVEKGQKFSVALPGLGEVPGQVIWARGVRFGFAFEEPIDLRDMRWSDLASTKLPGRYTDQKKYRKTGDSLKRPGFHVRRDPGQMPDWW